MQEQDSRNIIGSAGKWISDRLPTPFQMAAVTVLGLGWTLESDMPGNRVDLGDFGATATTKVVHNSGYDARLEGVSLLVSEPGNYKATVLRNGETVQAQEFNVGSEPAFITFSNVEPRGGIGGFFDGNPLNFGYGKAVTDYEVTLSRHLDGATATIRATL